MKKVGLGISVIILALFACKKTDNNDLKSTSTNVGDANLISGTVMTLPNVLNGILEFNDFTHLLNFIQYSEANDNLDSIYDEIGFLNHNLAIVDDPAMVDPDKVPVYKILNANKCVIIGDDILKLDAEDSFLITSRIVSVSDLSLFHTLPFSSTTMNKFSFVTERDSTFNFEGELSNNASGIMEVYTAPTGGIQVLKAFGKVSHCGPYIEAIDVFGFPTGRCERHCNYTHYFLWMVVGYSNGFEWGPC